MAQAPIRTFLDSGVLITAFKGQPLPGGPAVAVLKDPDRIFLRSIYRSVLVKIVYLFG